MSILADLAKRAGLIREAESLADQLLTTAIVEPRAAIVAKRAEIDQTRDAWPPAAELIATAARLVDEEGARWWAKNEREFLQGLAGNRIPGYDDTIRRLELPFLGFKPMPFDARGALEPDTVRGRRRSQARRGGPERRSGGPARARVGCRNDRPGPRVPGLRRDRAGAGVHLRLAVLMPPRWVRAEQLAAGLHQPSTNGGVYACTGDSFFQLFS